ncbi:MAG: single-stranded DNA-binding protein [Bacteroidales bacterium]|jgi:single-strand DNA-binding protein|nr:single-stranded DNA-binding protein [Bacteroidales bacterium]
MDLRNYVQLIGNIGQIPIIIKTSTGKSMTRFSVATNEQIKTKDGISTQTYWHNIVAWEKTAEYITKTCEKGTEVVISGKLTSRVYETKEGEKKYITEVVVNQIICNNKKTE